MLASHQSPPCYFLVRYFVAHYRIVTAIRKKIILKEESYISLGQTNKQIDGQTYRQTISVAAAEIEECEAIIAQDKRNPK